MTALTPVATFGPLLIESDVDAAVLTVLKMWMPTYLRRFEAERNLRTGTLKRPSSGAFTATLEGDDYPDPQLPAIVATTAQIEGTPRRDGLGTYDATWNVVVSAIARGRTRSEARWVAGAFGGCIRRILVQEGDDDHVIADCRWMSSNLGRIRDTTDTGRFLVASMNLFQVDTENVLQESVGPDSGDPIYTPADPGEPDTPYDPPADIVAVDLTTTIQED
jgi:hypothetical protein